MIKGIIVNIYLLMLPVVSMLCLIIIECLWVSVIGFVVILLCSFGLKQLWNLVNSFPQEIIAKTESDT